MNTLADATFRLPPLVVWLDELHRFLPGPYLTDGNTAVTAAAVRQLLDAPTPVVIAGALWPDHSRELRAQDRDPATGQLRPRWPVAGEILDNSRRREITLHSFTPAERRTAARLAGTDPRLATAVADQQFGATEVLAGAPDLTADGLGRIAEALYRRAAAAAAPKASHRLAGLLQRLDRNEEAEQVWLDGVAACDPDVRHWLAELLQRLGRHQDAQQVRGGRLEPDFFDRG